MHNHPLVLAVRFLLELAALVTYAWWGWHKFDSSWRFVAAIMIPLVAASIWGIFRVPGDPGQAVVPVPGMIRLLFEIVIFGSAVWMLFDGGATKIGWLLLVITVLLYLVSYQRILWLLSH